jgi:helix-turn-helix protein
MSSIAETSSILAELDKPRTLKEAAAHLGVGYHVVQRAARRGLVRTFNLGSSRRYVRLRDLLDLMERGTNR